MPYKCVGARSPKRCGNGIPKKQTNKKCYRRMKLLTTKNLPQFQAIHCYASDSIKWIKRYTFIELNLICYVSIINSKCPSRSCNLRIFHILFLRIIYIYSFYFIFFGFLSSNQFYVQLFKCFGSKVTVGTVINELLTTC